ncbi:MAG TPA: VWA domain-containing protein [Thermoanaerobaculia bacterium]
MTSPRRPWTRPLAGIVLGLLLAPALPLAAQEAEESFSETVQVSVVNLDVFVTDKKGQPVTGLRKEDFEVLEDGKPVEISNFYAESGGTAPAAPAVSAAMAAAAAGPAAKAAAPPAEDQRLRLVVFVDDVSLSAANRSRILQSVGQFLHRELKPGDEVMLVRYDEKLDVRRPFTADLAQVDADLAAVLRMPTDVRKYELSLSQALRELYSSINGGEGFGPLAEASLSNWAAQESSVVRGSLNAVDLVVSWLAGVPGRKAILYVSDGLPLVPGLDLFTIFTRAPQAASADKRTPEMVAQKFDLTHRFREVTSHASRNRITFYPIEAYGTRQSDSSLFDSVSLANRQNGLRFLAEDTGGRELFNAADVPAALARMSADFTTYYSIGYQPPRPGDTAEHKIEVRVRARGAQVRYRQWYRDKPTAELVAERTLAAMRFGAEDNPLAATVEIVPGKKAGETLVRVKVPISKLFLEPAAGSREGRLRLYLVAGGQDAMTPVRQTRLVTVSVPDAAAGGAKEYTHEIAIPLKDGTYSLGVGVRDELSATTSYLRRDFTVGKGESAAKR